MLTKIEKKENCYIERNQTGWDGPVRELSWKAGEGTWEEPGESWEKGVPGGGRSTSKGPEVGRSWAMTRGPGGGWCGWRRGEPSAEDRTQEIWGQSVPRSTRV